MSIDQSKKNFCNICGYYFVECWLNKIIFRDWFFGFCFWFLVYLTSTFNPLFFRSSFYSKFTVLMISSLNNFLTVSLEWNLEFASWRLVGGLTNFECKEAYCLASISSILQNKWNVLKIYFIEIAFNLKTETNIFKYSEDSFPDFVSFLSVKIS